MWPTSTRQQVLGELYAFNIDEDMLRSRFVQPYEEGGPITWHDRTIDADDVATIHIAATDSALPPAPNTSMGEYDVFKMGQDATNDWIKGPAGAASTTEVREPAPVNLSDHRRVMVVHGRNNKARDAIFTFLRALGLEPIEWEEAIAETGMGAPHNFDAVRAAMDVARAVVVVLTAEDRAGLLPDLAGTQDDEDVALRGQPRQNVILEAGLAMGADRDRTILVELGPIRRASDFDGLNTVRLSNVPQSRNALRTRLRTAGCELNDNAADWMDPGPGGDFEGCVIEWSPDTSSHVVATSMAAAEAEAAGAEESGRPRASCSRARRRCSSGAASGGGAGAPRQHRRPLPPALFPTMVG
jgi:predicted nucleotide-binding protein